MDIKTLIYNTYKFNFAKNISYYLLILNFIILYYLNYWLFNNPEC